MRTITNQQHFARGPLPYLNTGYWTLLTEARLIVSSVMVRFYHLRLDTRRPLAQDPDAHPSRRFARGNSDQTSLLNQMPRCGSLLRPRARSRSVRK